VGTDLARFAALLSDPSRASILIALMDGRARTGSELARHVGIGASTVSEHLGRLLDGGLLTVEAQGRHRYWRLSGAHIAGVIESMGVVSDAGTPPSAPRADPTLQKARTCYDHIAGRLGVCIFDSLEQGGGLIWVDGNLHLTNVGVKGLRQLGVADEHLQTSRRPVVRACLDWTERTHHLAGTAGQGLLEALLSNGWIRPGRRPRVIDVTRIGEERLALEFGW
jgi:DNA-binding transcriptional ArsR family regulator